MNEEIRADRLDFQRAWLVGIQFGRNPKEEVEDHLDELESLIGTLGIEVAGREIVRLAKPHPKFLVGKGKMEEIKTRLEEFDCDLLVFDDDLAPPQQHLWEAKSKKAVIDRRKVIIDIFGQRAQTKEARLQVELARLEYTLPRLKRAWTHLERQRGGGGFIGGAGEAQIEIDRRLVRDRIAKLKKELEGVRGARATQRKSRGKRPVPNAAIVGYTNSGKSTLLNAMTESDVLAENKLFATLDPTTRKIELPNNQEMLLTDTVGFIRKLPTSLIDAFKSTLEEAALADFLIHVVDSSHARRREHFDVTNAVLEELGAGGKETVLVLNKMDLVPEEDDPAKDFEDFDGRIIRASIHTGLGMDDLRLAVAELVSGGLEDLHLRIPASRFDVVSALHREGEVIEEKYEDSSVLVHALVPAQVAPQMHEYKTEKW